jgi:TolA-binding protein
MTGKEAYLHKLQVRLDEMNVELERLASRTRQLQIDARMRHAEQVEALEERRDALEKKIESLTAAGDDTWAPLKERADEALSALVAGMADAKERLESWLRKE